MYLPNLLIKCVYSLFSSNLLIYMMELNVANTLVNTSCDYMSKIAMKQTYNFVLSLVTKTA